MKTETPTTTPAKRRLAKAITVGLVGALLLTATGTLGGWRDTAQIAAPDTAITAGSLTLEASATSAWTLNGTAVPEDELGAVNLVPGGVLAYEGNHTPNLTGGMEAWMYFTGVEAITGELSESPAASQSWSVAGKQEAKKITSADSGVGVATGYEIRMAPIGAPVYATGTEGEALVLDVSRVKVVLSMVNPGGGGSTPEPPVEGEDPAAPWVINDPTVRQAVMDMVSVRDESELTQRDKAHVSSLSFYEVPGDADFSELADISGLKRFELDSYEMTSSQLTSLAKATQVQELMIRLQGRPEAGLSELAPMQNLTKLEVSGDFETLDVIGQFKKLESLTIDGAYVDSLDFLTGSSGLEELSLSRLSELTDISATASHAGLTTLSISWAEALTDLSPIAGSGITTLDLADTGASDFSFLSTLSSLQDLYVLQENFASLEPLRGAKSLTKINLHQTTPVTSLEPLRGMQQLERLSVGSATLSDGAPLASLTGLTSLILSGTSISDLGFTRSLTGLKDLSVGKKTSDLTPLTGMTSLTSLNLRDAVGITSLEPLRGLTGITRLDTRGTSVTDFSPVSDFSYVLKDTGK